jgi:hypothetical protein
MTPERESEKHEQRFSASSSESQPDSNPESTGTRELEFLLSIKPGESFEEFKTRAIETLRLNGMLR